MEKYGFVFVILMTLLLYNVFKVSTQKGELKRYIDTLDTYTTILMLLTVAFFDVTIGLVFLAIYFAIALLELLGEYWNGK